MRPFLHDAEGQGGTTRRGFLSGGAAAGAALLLDGCRSARRPGTAAAAGTARPLARPLRVGLIGAAGQGETLRREICRAGDRIAAICDVDATALAAAREDLAALNRAGPPVRAYKDFRILLLSEPDLDALFIATPDHGHAIQAAWALARKIPVYVEAPAARTPGELRMLARLAEKNRTPVWQALPNLAEGRFQQAAALLRAGIIGPLREAHAWTSEPLWPQGMPRPEGKDPIPGSLDWNLWLGPAPERPFKEKIYHRAVWRGWRDFGTGALGSSGPHLLNLLFRCFPLDAPVRIDSLTPPPPFPDTYAVSSHLRMTFRDGQTLDWIDGGMLSEIPQMYYLKRTFGSDIPAEGCLLTGDLGVWLMAGASGRRHYFALHRDDDRLIAMEEHPGGAPREKPPRAPSLPQIFLSELRHLPPGQIPSELALPLTETVLTGCIAQQTGGTLAWKTSSGRFKRNPAADALAHPRARAGWRPEDIPENIGK